jgi:hypothetical protein
MYFEAIIQNWLTAGQRPNGMIIRLQGFGNTKLCGTKKKSIDCSCLLFLQNQWACLENFISQSARKLKKLEK